MCKAAVSQGEQDELARVSDKTAARFNLSVNEGLDSLLMQCAARGIQCDSGNRELYELVARMNVSAREPKKIKEDLLLSMCEAFPDDPYPCIELASLYHGKNAFRKAENILKKAMEMAPYDSRVQDMHVISLVISADKSLNRENFQRARQDLEKAQRIDTGNNALLLREKDLFYQICEQPEIAEKTIGSTLDGLSLFERFKLVSMLRMDAIDKPKKELTKIFSKIETMFKKELKQISHLASEELLTLLTPFPREWQHAFASLKVFQVFLGSENKVLRYLSGDDLIRCLDRVLEPENITFFHAEFLRRTRKKKKEPSHDLLKFYAIVLEGIDHNDWDVDGLIDLVDDADPEMKKKLKAAGERLACHAHGPFRYALQNLEFEILEDLFDDPFDDLFDDPFDLLDEYDDDYDDDDEFNPFGTFPQGMMDIEMLKDPFMKKIFSENSKELKRKDPGKFKEIFKQLKATLEAFIDDKGLRGTHELVLNKVKKEVMEINDEFSGLILALNLIYPDEGKKELSKEAKAVFLH